MSGAASAMAEGARPSIICCGLSCLDLQLHGCTKGAQEEAIETFEGASYCAGGSASMTATTLALLGQEVRALTKVGKDEHADVLVGKLRRAGVICDCLIETEEQMTSMAVLPIFKAGGRGCFVNLAANDAFTKEEVLSRLSALAAPVRDRTTNFHLGYPHLLKRLQGENLSSLLLECRRLLPNALLSVDLNGVTEHSHSSTVLDAALPLVDVLHLNEDEAAILGAAPGAGASEARARALRDLHAKGVAVVLLSLGADGSLVSVTPDEERLRSCRGALPRWPAGSTSRAPAFRVSEGAAVNANGAGDALVGGFILAAAWPGQALGAAQCGTFAAMVARQRCDETTRDGGGMGAEELIAAVRAGDLPEAI